MVRVFPLSGKVRISCCMEVENISNELWVALWDVVSVDELGFATLEQVLKWEVKVGCSSPFIRGFRRGPYSSRYSGW